MEYIRLSESLKRYELIPVTEDIWNKISSNEVDYYTSIFRYNQSHYDYWKKNNTVSGIKDVVTSKILFDFDNAKDPEAARQDAITLVSRLLAKGIKPDNIQVAFSGSKGFSVEVDSTSRFSQEEFKNITFALAEDLKSFDRVVNDSNRIVRVVATKHPKSGLYKFPLTVNQLSEFDIATIKNLASNVDNIDAEVMSAWGEEVILPESIVQMRGSPKKEKKAETEVHDLDLSLRPKWLSEAKYALQEGFFEDGERNTACMILASSYKNQGFSKELTYNILKGTLRLRAQRLGHEEYDTKELWHTIIKVVFSTDWKGGTYSYENTPLLQEVTKRLGLSEPKSETSKTTVIGEVGNKFIDFAKNFDKNRIKTGIPELDEDIILTTGMVVGLLGAPSSGKTSHALNILEHSSKSGINCGMGSHDMYDALLFTRLLQKECPYDFKKITEMVKSGEMDNRLTTAWEKVTESYKNVAFNFQASPTVDNLYEFVDEYEVKHGSKMKLLIVDYLEKLAGPYSDATANSAYVAGRLADLAKERDLCVIILLQPQKQAGDPSDALLSMRQVKGSSRVEQDLRLILTTWRPGFNPENNNEDDNFSSIAVVKNNMGPVGKYDFKWDGISGRIRGLMDGEREDLKHVIQKQAQRKAEKNKGDLI